MNAETLINSYKRNAVDFVEGTGAELVDSRGKRYLDLLSGIAVCGLGHANPEIADVIAEQSRKLVHVSNLFGNDPMRQLARELQASTGGWGRVFFCNSGAEANECAIKIARKSGSPERFKVLCAEGGFHGRTMATLSATGQPEKWKGFEPMLQGFVHAPFNDLEAFARALDPHTGAILVEPIQGERGVIPAEEKFLRGLRELADKAKIPLIFDEIQTGMGRTGKLWAFQHFGVKPDIFTAAKGLANGLPIGACIAGEPYASVFSPGDHGTTFGGGPVVCAAALKVLEILQRDNILDRAFRFGQMLREKLQELPEVESVRGVGLMCAAVIKSPCAFKAVELGLNHGVIFNATSDRVLRFLPPLVISEQQLSQAVSRLGQSLKEAAAYASN